MNIQNISKEKQTVTLELTSGELIGICNALYKQFEDEDEKKKESFLQLYSDMIMIRDLCQYGHIDNACLQSIVKCRNDIGKGLDGILSEDDIDVFNAYLSGNSIPIAFGNSDWMAIYNKIVGEYGRQECGEKIRQWIHKTDN